MNLPDLTSFKISVFEVLERLNEKLRSQNNRSAQTLYEPRNNSASIHQPSFLWVYVSTIGELNAVSCLLNALLDACQDSQLVLLTDHPHYLDSYIQKHPESIIIDHGDTGSGIEVFFKKHPPFLFLIAEISLTIFDAPCRLSFKTLYYGKKSGASIIAVNGWIYGEAPSCTMDALERKLFGDHYTDIIDQYLIQKEADAERLLNHGVTQKKLHVTGNLKFDNMISNSPTPLIRSNIIASDRLILVSGCVTNIKEQELILESFKQLKIHHPELLLIMAPRHPENKDRMTTLETMLKSSGWSYQFRTEQTKPAPSDTDILILDTIGELHSFYSLGDICYVGLNHNLLEPLSFFKPTFVTPGWDLRYPSYPVYLTLKEKGLITECENSSPEDLSGAIIKYLEKQSTLEPESFRETLISLTGSLEKSISITLQELRKNDLK